MSADTLFLIISAIALVLLLASLGYHGQRRSPGRPRGLTPTASSQEGEDTQAGPPHPGRHGCC